MKDSAISWTDHTFNPWIGCHRVSAGCLHCYAETRDRRYGDGLWGKDAPRRVTSDANWRQPLRWNRDAEAAGHPAFVFCASLADVFEDRPDLYEPRARLFDLIDQTPHLVWMLLTKRPENIGHLVPRGWVDLGQGFTWWPRNVWIGTTIESNDVLNERLEWLDGIDGAPVRFVSCEPLIGPVDLTRWARPPVEWVICGGESGPGYRAMNLDHARSLRDQCERLTIPFWFKQVGGTVKVAGEWGGNHLDGRVIHERPPAYDPSLDLV